MLADRRLWLNADKTRLVEDGADEAAHLLAGQAGEMIPDDEAIRLALYLNGDRVEQVASPEPLPAGDGAE